MGCSPSKERIEIKEETDVLHGWEGSWKALEATPENEIPPPRSMHTACLVEESLFVFGGEEGDFGTMPRDLWRFNLRTSTWERVKVNPVSEQPPGRKQHTLFAMGRALYLFGGSYGRVGGMAGFHGDIWVFDITKSVWRNLTPKSNGGPASDTPCGRRAHTCDVWDKHAYIFGGEGEKGAVCGDLWRFEVNPDLHPRQCTVDFGYGIVQESREGWWTQVGAPDSGPVPSARSEHSSVALEAGVFVFGGRGAGGQSLGDLWRYDADSECWHQVSDGREMLRKLNSLRSQAEQVNILDKEHRSTRAGIAANIASIERSDSLEGPRPRYGKGNLVLAQGEIYLYGGFAAPKQRCLGDLWKLQLAREWGRNDQGPSGVWQCLHRGEQDMEGEGTQPQQQAPPPRGGHTAVSCRGGILILGGLSHALEADARDLGLESWCDAWVYDTEHSSGWHLSHRSIEASRAHHTLHPIRESHVASDTLGAAAAVSSGDSMMMIPEPEEAFLVFGGVQLPEREKTGGAWIYHLLPRPKDLPMPQPLAVKPAEERPRQQASPVVAADSLFARSHTLGQQFSNPSGPGTGIGDGLGASPLFAVPPPAAAPVPSSGGGQVLWQPKKSSWW